MKMNKLMKILIAILMMITILTSISQVAFAEAPDPSNFPVITNNPASNSVTSIIGTIIGIAQIIGVGVAIIMLIILAIRYISASPDGKAEIKKSATQYIIGAILLFGATGLLQIIKNFALKLG